MLLYSRDQGRREAQIGASVSPGTEDIGFRNRVAIVFTAAPSHDVMFRIRDEHGRPAIASLLVQDALGRVYPARSKRLAPDFFFQRQVYRGDGEHLRLPAGTYSLIAGRGPEYQPQTRTVTVLDDGPRAPIAIDLTRWIDAASLGWYSGDHHVHAAGCSHYESPTEGVRPEDMMRHVQGEALSIGAVLNWGPGYYHQRQFFEATRQPPLDRLDAAALRPRGLRLSVEPLRTSRAAAAEGPGLPGDAPDRGLAVVGPADPAVGPGAGRGRGLRALRAGACRSRAAISPTTRCPRSTASAPTSSSSTSRTTRWTSSPRSTRRSCTS